MPGGRGKLRPEDNTNGFQKNPQNINMSGRPRKSFASFNIKCKENGIQPLTQSDYIGTLSYLYQLTEVEIKELAEDKEQPLAIRLLVAELTDPNTRGKTLNDLRDYLFHKGIINVKSEVTTIGKKLPKWMIDDGE
jgi:hypothetical protein